MKLWRNTDYWQPCICVKCGAKYLIEFDDEEEVLLMKVNNWEVLHNYLSKDLLCCKNPVLRNAQITRKTKKEDFIDLTNIKLSENCD
jgi:hypothetical protein